MITEKQISQLDSMLDEIHMLCMDVEAMRDAEDPNNKWYDMLHLVKVRLQDAADEIEDLQMAAYHANNK